MSMPPGRRLSLEQLAVARAVTGSARLLARTRPHFVGRVLARARTGARPATFDQALAAYETIVAASPHCAGRSQCLPRSLAVALLCRLHGTWPTWCSGVRTQPFRAHAWVEADGRPVGEVPGFCGFHVLMSIPPDPHAISR